MYATTGRPEPTEANQQQYKAASFTDRNRGVAKLQAVNAKQAAIRVEDQPGDIGEIQCNPTWSGSNA